MAATRKKKRTAQGNANNENKNKQQRKGQHEVGVELGTERCDSANNDTTNTNSNVTQDNIVDLEGGSGAEVEGNNERDTATNGDNTSDNAVPATVSEHTDSGGDISSYNDLASESFYSTSMSKKMLEDEEHCEKAAKRCGKRSVYKAIKFLHEDIDFELNGKVSQGLKKELQCCHLSNEEWAPIWFKHKKDVLQGHQQKRSEHGTKARNRLYGELGLCCRTKNCL